MKAARLRHARPLGRRREHPSPDVVGGENGPCRRGEDERLDAIGDRAEVIVDGGIRRGADVLKAIAMGARAVQIGRPMVWGLVVDGEDGVRDVLNLLRDEPDLAMALAGCRSIDEISYDLLRPE